MTTETLEERVTKIEATLPHLATKADLGQLEVRLIKWMVAVQFLGIAAVASVMRFL